jgi:hypothetical protein
LIKINAAGAICGLSGQENILEGFHMGLTELPSAADLGALADELEHNERLRAFDGRDSYPVNWVSRFQVAPGAIYVAALRIAARAADREALTKVCGTSATNDERVSAIQRYLLGH